MYANGCCGSRTSRCLFQPPLCCSPKTHAFRRRWSQNLLGLPELFRVCDRFCLQRIWSIWKSVFEREYLEQVWGFWFRLFIIRRLQSIRHRPARYSGSRGQLLRGRLTLNAYHPEIGSGRQYVGWLKRACVFVTCPKATKVKITLSFGA